jgi:hypothetical protein
VPEELDSGFGLVLWTGSKLFAVSDLIDEAELGVEEQKWLAVGSGYVFVAGSAAEYLFSISVF